MTTAWIYLLAAGLTEIGWALGLKYTDGWTRLWPSLITIALMILSFTLLSQALKTIPIGTAYAVWTGIGAVGVAIIGMMFLKEPTSTLRILCILAIVSGIVGLKLLSGQNAASSAPPQG